MTKAITITAVANPTASFTASPTTVGVGERVNVDASASQPAPGGDRFLIRYDWTWGDGRTSEGVRQSHTYSQAGSYTITLTVADNTGRTGTSDAGGDGGSGAAAGRELHVLADRAARRRARLVRRDGLDGASGPDDRAARVELRRQ